MLHRLVVQVVSEMMETAKKYRICRAIYSPRPPSTAQNDDDGDDDGDSDNHVEYIRSSTSLSGVRNDTI